MANQIELKNFGVMNGKSLTKLLTGFPPTATIKKTDILVRVSTPKGQVVLSAARLSRNVWHVRAADGLLVEKEGA